MRLAPFALFALVALPACAPYGYGYAGSYGGPVYNAPGPVYGSPYYADPGYVAPPVGGVLLLGGDRDDRRRYDRREYDRGREGGREGYREGYRGQERGGERQAPPQRGPSVFSGPQQRAPSAFSGPPQRAPSAFSGGQGGGHAPGFNPANPTAQGGGDR